MWKKGPKKVTYDPGRIEAPENRRGKSGLSNLLLE